LIIQPKFIEFEFIEAMNTITKTKWFNNFTINNTGVSDGFPNGYGLVKEIKGTAASNANDLAARFNKKLKPMYW